MLSSFLSLFRATRQSFALGFVWSLALSFALLLPALILPICANAGQHLKLGTLPAADTIALHVALEEGLFQEHGLEVELIPFQSALELNAAIRARAVDGCFGDIMNVLLLHAGGVPQTIVATTSHSESGQRFFGVAVAPASTAQSLADLKNAKTAIGRATIVAFVLDRLLQHSSLPDDHVEKVDIRQIPVRLQMLLSGRLDAAVLPEPLLSLVEAKGCRVVADDRMLSVPLAVVSLGRDKAAPETAKAFRTALGKAMAKINADPDLYQGLMRSKGLLPPDAATTYRLPRFDPAHTPAPPTPQAVADVAVWLNETGLTREIPDTDVLLHE